MAIDIYTSAFCPYCQRAKRLLSDKGVAFTEIDLLEQPGRRPEMLARSGGRTTVPQIFVGNRHVGGCDDLYALDRAGGLEPLLAAERA
jgi:glutaredoxin 3